MDLARPGLNRPVRASTSSLSRHRSDVGDPGISGLPERSKEAIVGSRLAAYSSLMNTIFGSTRVVRRAGT